MEQNETRVFSADVDGNPVEFCAMIGWLGTQPAVIVFTKNGERKVIQLKFNIPTLALLGSLSTDEKINAALLVCKERGYLENMGKILETGSVIDEFF